MKHVIVLKSPTHEQRIARLHPPDFTSYAVVRSWVVDERAEVVRLDLDFYQDVYQDTGEREHVDGATLYIFKLATV